MDQIIIKNYFVGSTLSRKIKIIQWAKLANHIAGNINFIMILSSISSIIIYRENKQSSWSIFCSNFTPQKKEIDL
ncbi:hypothetical protein ACTFIR_002877 [Dictyostelium discoideum]